MGAEIRLADLRLYCSLQRARTASEACNWGLNKAVEQRLATFSSYRMKQPSSSLAWPGGFGNALPARRICLCQGQATGSCTINTTFLSYLPARGMSVASSQRWAALRPRRWELHPCFCPASPQPSLLSWSVGSVSSWREAVLCWTDGSCILTGVDISVSNSSSGNLQSSEFLPTVLPLAPRSRLRLLQESSWSHTSAPLPLCWTLWLQWVISAGIKWFPTFK